MDRRVAPIGAGGPAPARGAQRRQWGGRSVDCVGSITALFPGSNRAVVVWWIRARASVVGAAVASSTRRHACPLAILRFSRAAASVSLPSFAKDRASQTFQILVWVKSGLSGK